MKALKQVITDCNDSLLSDVFIGRQEGFQDDLRGDLETLREEVKDTKIIHLPFT